MINLQSFSVMEKLDWRSGIFALCLADGYLSLVYRNGNRTKKGLFLFNLDKTEKSVISADFSSDFLGLFLVFILC